MDDSPEAQNIVVIGGSAGAISDLTEIVGGLPGDLPAPLLAVVHIASAAPSMLPSIISRAGSIHAKHPQSGEQTRPGHMYIAPPDYHMLVDDGRVQLARKPRENGHRPAINPLFRSAVASYGDRVIGVILSGMRDDGAAGLAEIKEHGGRVIAIDPETTPYGMMPRTAIDEVGVDEVLPSHEIAAAIVRACCPEKEVAASRSGNGRKRRNELATVEVSAMRGRTDPKGHPTALTCPECSGPLFDDSKRGVPAFRCRTGHRYSLGSLLMDRSESVERALWVAVEALREKAILAENMADMARKMNHRLSAERYKYQAGTADRYASMIEEYFSSGNGADEELARAEEEQPAQAS